MFSMAYIGTFRHRLSQRFGIKYKRHRTKGDDCPCMNESKPSGVGRKRRSSLARDAETGRLPRLLKSYLESCHADSEFGVRKTKERFPNLAGFCRWLGCGIGEATELKDSYPQLYDCICAILEDEALNADLSPTLISAYLKQRLGYADKPTADKRADCGPLQLLFEHDMEEAGQ